jgi:MFS transporter, DHA1 family, multidrug resistance protein
MRKRTIFLLYFTLSLVMMLPILSIDFYLPAFPAIMYYFHTTAAYVQTTLSLYLLGYGVVQLIYGALADRFGYKKILVLGLAIYIIATILCMLMPNIYLFILMRLLQGVGASVGSLIGRVIILDVFKEKSAHVFATIYPIIGISPAIAPLIGGMLTQLSHTWISTFIALLIIGVLAFILVVSTLKETKRESTKLNIKHLIIQYKTVGTNKKFWGYASMFIGQYQAWFIYIIVTPFMFHRLGLNAQEIGVLYLPVALVFFVVNKIVKRLLGCFDFKWLIFFGLVLFGIGSFLYLAFIFFMHNYSVIAIICPMLFIIAGCAFLAPIGTAGAMLAIPMQMKSYASALLGFVQLSLGAFVTFMLAHFFFSNLITLAVAINLLFIILCILYYFTFFKKRSCCLDHLCQ